MAKAKTTTPTPAPQPTITEMCDQCHLAHARVRIEFNSGLTLHLCKHHYEDQERTIAALYGDRVKILDERDLIQ